MRTKLTIDDMQTFATKRGGKCLSDEYINSFSKLKWLCANGHVWEAKPGNVIRLGSWCPYCNKRNIRENICREILEMIFKKPFPKKKPSWLRNRNGNLMELDGYNEELSIAFEYHGEQHFHYSIFFHQGKDKTLSRRISDDTTKRNICRKNGVRLIEVSYELPTEGLYKNIIDQCHKLGIKLPKHTSIDVRELNSKYHHKYIEKLNEFAKKRGGKLLSNVYAGTEFKLKWRCKNMHIWEATPANIVHGGYWCPKCSGKSLLSIEEMCKLAVARGGRCLSKAYTNNHQKLEWECKKGHQWEAKPNDIKSGHWCPYCAGMAPLTIDEMLKIAESRGGKCLSKKYINGYTKLKWQCKNGHVWLASPSNIKNGGYWCPFCSGKTKHTIKEMGVLAKLRNGKCLSTKYINIYTKLRWQCDKKHRWDASPGNVLKGSWCPVCAVEKRKPTRNNL